MAVVQRSLRRGTSSGQRPKFTTGTFIKVIGTDYNEDGIPAQPKGLLFKMKDLNGEKDVFALVKPSAGFVEAARNNRNFPANAKTALGAKDPNFVPAMLKVKSDDAAKDITTGDGVKLTFYPAYNQDATHTMTAEDRVVHMVRPEDKTKYTHNLPETLTSVPAVDVVAYGFELFSRAKKSSFNPSNGQLVVTPADTIVSGYGHFSMRYTKDEKALVDIILTRQIQPKSWDEVYELIQKGLSRSMDIRRDVTYIEPNRPLPGEAEPALHVFRAPFAKQEERNGLNEAQIEELLESKSREETVKANEEFETLREQYQLDELNVWVEESYCMGQDLKAWARMEKGQNGVVANAIEREINYNGDFKDAMDAVRKAAGFPSVGFISNGPGGFIANERPANWATMTQEERSEWSRNGRVPRYAVMCLKMSLSITPPKEAGSRGFVRKFALEGGEVLVLPQPAANMTPESAAAFDWGAYLAVDEEPEQQYGEQAPEHPAPASHDHNAYNAPQQGEIAGMEQPGAYQPAQHQAASADGQQQPHGEGRQVPAAPSQPVDDIDDDIPF